ncbi:MAG TPA: hypothetical protein VNW92_20235 [Polyangiaceae bacterium]|jgi:hypothetical protein|nr:hypothetical protein [Polyangiaceae bacterium]
MSDPKHLTDDGADASDFERELLGAAQNVGLSAGEKRAIWTGIALQAFPAATASAAASGSLAPGAATAKAGLALGPWLKGLLVICGLAGISAGIYGWRHAAASRAQAAQVASAHAVVVASAPSAQVAPASDAPPATDVPSSAAVEAPSSASPATAASANQNASPAESKSALREESLAVLEIRHTLRAGDASGALGLLEQARQRFPRGALSQEREALGIEALAKSGARAAAARQADAFLRAHPKSPYAADVQSFQSH